MRKFINTYGILIVLLVILIDFGILSYQLCEVTYNYCSNNTKEDFDKTIASISTPKQLEYWLWKNVTYKSDMEIHGKNEYWQNPQETFNLRSGDCEDFALFARYVLIKLGHETKFIGYHFMKERKRYGHAICVFNNKDNLAFFSNMYMWVTEFKGELSKENIIKFLESRVDVTDVWIYKDDHTIESITKM